MKRAVVLSVLLAILPLILSFATVVAQDEPSVTLDSAFMPQVKQTEVAASQQLLFPAQQDVTPTPNRCEVNFFTTTRQGVSARYYLYLSKWLAFSIFNTAGTLLLTSSLQSFSTSTQLQVDSKVGKWFEEVSVAMVARGIEAGWTEYMTTSAVTSFVTNAPINAGDASLSVVGCE